MIASSFDKLSGAGTIIETFSRRGEESISVVKIDSMLTGGLAMMLQTGGDLGGDLFYAENAEENKSWKSQLSEKKKLTITKNACRKLPGSCFFGQLRVPSADRLPLLPVSQSVCPARERWWTSTNDARV